ncbi:unnamed protein product [Rotaria sordida]|uniref:Uncharacterized protein n=1 Tax=Rotaria sordida TaxID=392033 RepID=A0A818R045_9BILA|nr:unnamed protein product [Rotaria sordida]CAF3938433.1 unnamed protein product [Rotaria sordida]
MKAPSQTLIVYSCCPGAMVRSETGDRKNDSIGKVANEPRSTLTPSDSTISGQIQRKEQFQHQQASTSIANPVDVSRDRERTSGRTSSDGGSVKLADKDDIGAQGAHSNGSEASLRSSDTYNLAVQKTTQSSYPKFRDSKYHGPIPVLIADHDMHELTVAIALQGFRVSQLNPADSHGVFGEYWQNHGPAVEEKLALTTLGLLVQHHLINPSVLDKSKYHII